MATGTLDIFEHLECNVCSEQYHCTKRTPKVLPCGETLCGHCIETLSEAHMGLSIRCPMCKNKTFFDSKKKLPTNLSIIRILESCYRACAKCKKFYTREDVETCEDCEEIFCTLCHIGHLKGLIREEITSASAKQKDAKEEQDKAVDRMATLTGNYETFCTDIEKNLENNASIKQLKLTLKKTKEFTAALADIIDRIACFQAPMLSVPETLGSPMKFEYDDQPVIVFYADCDDPGDFHQPWAAAFQDGYLHIISEYITPEVPVTVEPAIEEPEDDKECPTNMDNNSKFVSVYDTDGLFIDSYELEKEPRDISATSSGEIVLCTGGSDLQIYQNNVHVKEHTPFNGYMGGYMDCPRSIDCITGKWYMADSKKNRVMTYDTVNWTTTLGNASHGKLTCPIAVAVDPTTKDVYACCEDGKDIHVFSDHTFKAKITSSDIPSEFRSYREMKPVYLSCRSDGLLCITDTAHHAVHLMRGWHHVQTLGTNKDGGDHPGEFRNPGGTLFIGLHSLVVCDTGNSRVQIFKSVNS